MAGSKRGSTNSRRLILLLLTSGFFLVGLLFDYMPMIVDNQIKRTIELATNEEIQSIWSRPPVDFHSYYWLYDILNAESKFSSGQEKIRVRRVGPYHFTARMEKRILDVSANKYRIRYNSTRHIYLADEQSSASLDEPLVLLNPIYASLVSGARELTRDQDSQSRQMMLGSLSRMIDRFNESLFINSSARSALIGRPLPIVDKLLKMAATFGFEMELPSMSLGAGKLFGYLSMLNGTWDGPYEIYSGYQASMNSLGDIISYKGRKRLTEFQARCNRLQASAGELRPMPIEEGASLEMFQPRFCRIVHLNPTGSHRLKEGLAISYELAPNDFLSGQLNADNRCFCLNNTSNDYCSLNGALEVGPCSYHSPIVVTLSNIKPDERITGSVMNWDPDMLRGDVELLPRADERGQIFISKRLGVPLQGDITLTLFMRLAKDTSFRHTSQLADDSFVPILTLRERGMIPPKLGQIIVNLENFLSLTTHFKVVMYLTAVVLLCSLTGHYYTKSAGQPSGPRISPSADDGDQSSQQSRGAKLGPAASHMIQGSRVALPAAASASERANSADSSRSQPPSRVSHSSLDVASGDEQVGDESGDRSARGQAGVSAGQLIPNNSAGDSEQRSRSRTPKLQQHKMFSKVDEEQSESSWRAKSQPELCSQQKETEHLATTNGLVDSSSLSRSATGVAASAGAKASAEAEASGASSGDMADGQAANKRRQSTGKRNWFMKVCSNFVRMLNGIRSSINDASQLDINENDYQDKQLEMLAGKIDSWYQSSPVTPDSSLARSSGSTNEAPAEPSASEPAPAPASERAPDLAPDLAAAQAPAPASSDAAQQQSPSISDRPRLGSGGEQSGEKVSKQQTSGAESSAKQDDGRQEGADMSLRRMNKEHKDTSAEMRADDGHQSREAEALVLPQTPRAGDSSASGAMLEPTAQMAGEPSDLAPEPRARADTDSERPKNIPAASESDKNLADKAAPAAAEKEEGPGMGLRPTGAREEPEVEEEGEREEQKQEQKHEERDAGSAESGRSRPPMEQNEERSDSIQSNETVINKSQASGIRLELGTEKGLEIGSEKATEPRPAEGRARAKGEARRHAIARSPVGPNKLRLGGQASAAQLAKLHAGRGDKEPTPVQLQLQLQADLSDLAAPLSDKKAALESMEKALMAANRVEGY